MNEKLALEYVKEVYGGDMDFYNEALNVISWINSKGTLQKIYDYIDDLGYDIFMYIKDNYKDTLLEFEEYSSYERAEISENKFCIKYYDQGYDIYEYSWFRIPMERINNDTWKEYIDERNTLHLEIEHKKSLEIEEEREKHERELYKTLKEKYEKDSN